MISPIKILRKCLDFYLKSSIIKTSLKQKKANQGLMGMIYPLMHLINQLFFHTNFWK